MPELPLSNPEPPAWAGRDLLSSSVRARWLLRFKALVFRFLMTIGMFFHRTALPYPPSPTFELKIPTTVSSRRGVIQLCFYAPLGYDAHVRKLRGRARTRRHFFWSNEESDIGFQPPRSESSQTSSDADSVISLPSRATWMHRLRPLNRLIRRRPTDPGPSLLRRKYPVVVNFHGGGFTLGKPTDDCRWASSVVARTDAVVMSVGYRLAPEYPFPTAVEDGVDALLWLAKYGDEYDLDAQKIVLSGFSSGGNLSFTVPLRLDDELKRHGLPGLVSGQVIPVDTENLTGLNTRTVSPARSQDADSAPSRGTGNLVRSTTASTAATFVDTPLPSQAHIGATSSTKLDDPFNPHSRYRIGRSGLAPGQPGRYALSRHHIPPHTSLRICGIVSFYPPVDYTLTRDQRRATSISPSMNLSRFLTDMFDDGYIGVLNPSDGPTEQLYADADSLFFFPPDHPSLSSTNISFPGWPLPAIMALASPFLSPAVAHDDALTRALPDNILIISSEWDMLTWETKRFASRLSTLPSSAAQIYSPSYTASNGFLCPPGGPPGPAPVQAAQQNQGHVQLEAGLLLESGKAASLQPGRTKKVQYWCVPQVPHAWDKKPYFWGREHLSVTDWYKRACEQVSGMVGTDPIADPAGGASNLARAIR